MSDLLQSFSKIISETFTKYRGCLIEKSGDRFMQNRTSYPTIEAAKEEIDEKLDELKNILNTGK